MIKKTLGIFFILAVLSMPSNASDLSLYCAEPHDMSLKSTRFLSTITGFTPLSQAIANSIVKKELTKATGTKNFKVKMKSFSANDLAAGRFKSLDINGDKLNFDGVYVSKFNASTVCDFNYVKATPKSITFIDNFPMTYSMTITENDLRKTVLSKDYLSFLNSLNVKFSKISLFELKDVDVNLNDDKFHFVLKLNNRMFNHNIPINLHLAAKMKVQDGKIKVTEVSSEGLNQKLNLTQMTNLLNLINPLNFTVDVLGNANSKLALNNLDIQGKKLVLDGTILIPGNTKENRK